MVIFEGRFNIKFQLSIRKILKKEFNVKLFKNSKKFKDLHLLFYKRSIYGTSLEEKVAKFDVK